MQLVGYKLEKGKNDEYSWDGWRLFFNYEQKGVEGYATDSVYISSQNLGDEELVLGGQYTVLYNKFKKVAALKPD